MTWLNGMQFSGTWYHGSINNSFDAKIISPQGDVYRGSLGVFTVRGYGTFEWVDGSKYTGQWSRDQLQEEFSINFDMDDGIDHETLDEYFPAIIEFMKTSAARKRRREQLELRYSLSILRNREKARYIESIRVEAEASASVC
jgi:hypothetical protein